MPVSSCFKLRTDKHQAEMPKEQQRDFAAVLQRFCSGFACLAFHAHDLCSSDFISDFDCLSLFLFVSIHVSTICYYIVHYMLVYVSMMCSMTCFAVSWRFERRFYDLISQPFWRHRLAWRLRLAGLEDRIVFLVRHGGDLGQLGRLQLRHAPPCSAMLRRSTRL